MDSLWLARPKPKLLLIRVILNQIHEFHLFEVPNVWFSWNPLFWKCEIHSFYMVGQSQTQPFAHKGLSLINFINFNYLRSQMGDVHEIHGVRNVKSMDSLWLARPRPKLLHLCPESNTYISNWIQGFFSVSGSHSKNWQQWPRQLHWSTQNRPSLTHAFLESHSQESTTNIWGHRKPCKWYKLCSLVPATHNDPTSTHNHTKPFKRSTLLMKLQLQVTLNQTFQMTQQAVAQPAVACSPSFSDRCNW